MKKPSKRRRILFFSYALLLVVVLTAVVCLTSLRYDNTDTLMYRKYRDHIEILGLTDRSLTDVVIPETIVGLPVIAIRQHALENVISVKSVTISNGVKSIGEHAFAGCVNLTSISIPNSVTAIGIGAFKGCLNLSGITIPGAVTKIDDYTFKSCTSLTNIIIPDSVISIGNGAFSNCRSLTGITVPDGVVFIGNEAFNTCSSLTGILIPGSVTTIGDATFFGCDALKSVSIEAGITSIGQYAFNGCSSLMSVSIPESISYIGDCAFNGCRSLAHIYYAGSKEQWDKLDIRSHNDSLSHAELIFQSQKADQKQTITGSPVFSSLTIQQLVENDYNIFYGRVVEKSEETFEHLRRPDATYGWLYHTVSIEVIDCFQSPCENIKPGDLVTYRDLGGENERYFFRMEGVRPLSVGEYVVIADSVNAFLSPYRCFVVEGEQILVPWEVLRGTSLEGVEQPISYIDFQSVVNDVIESNHKQ